MQRLELSIIGDNIDYKENNENKENRDNKDNKLKRRSTEDITYDTEYLNNSKSSSLKRSKSFHQMTFKSDDDNQNEESIEIFNKDGTNLFLIQIIDFTDRTLEISGLCQTFRGFEALVQ